MEQEEIEESNRKFKVRLMRLMNDKAYIDIEILGDGNTNNVKEIDWCKITKVGTDYIELGDADWKYKTVIIPIANICNIGEINKEEVKEYLERHEI